MTLEFSGKPDLIRRLGAVVDGDCAHTVTDRVRNELCALMDERKLDLPDSVYDCPGDRYGRRLIHKDEARGYTVMAMTWGPGLGTPIHDHSGMWCVEAVWDGQIEVVQYELTGRDGDRHRFEPRTTMRAGIGSAGSLIPPHEFHTIRNPSATDTAVTIHIYAGEMNYCSVFNATEGGWYLRESRRLALDAA